MELRPAPKMEIVGTDKAADTWPSPLSAARSYLHFEISAIDYLNEYLPQRDLIEFLRNEETSFWESTTSFFEPKIK